MVQIGSLMTIILKLIRPTLGMMARILLVGLWVGLAFGQDFNVAFVGDILIHDALQVKAVEMSNIKGDRNGGTHSDQRGDRFFSLFKEMQPVLGRVDLAIGNLEGPVALGINPNGKFVGDIGFVYDRNIYSGTNFRFNYHPFVLEDLARVGFDLLTVANNHSLDRTFVGVDATIEAFGKSQLQMVGSIASPYSAHTGEIMDWVRVVSKNGIRVAFLACSEHINGLPDPHHQILKCFADKALIDFLISKIQQELDTDAIVILPHWGDEYQQKPNSQQRAMAKHWLEFEGVLAVVGSHPHVLQPVEMVTMKDGEKKIMAYSLGNFLAFQSHVERKTSIVLMLKFSLNSYDKFKTDVTEKPKNKWRLIQAEALPTYRDGFSVYPYRAEQTFPIDALRLVQTMTSGISIVNESQAIEFVDSAIK